MKQLSRATLLNLLHLYEGAIRELEALDDPSVGVLLGRMRRHRIDVIAALAESSSASAGGGARRPG